MSTSVVISGDAMIAGSRCALLARSGSMHPTSFAATTVPMSDRAMTSASAGSSYWIIMRTPL